MAIEQESDSGPSWWTGPPQSALALQWGDDWLHAVRDAAAVEAAGGTMTTSRRAFLKSTIAGAGLALGELHQLAAGG